MSEPIKLEKKFRYCYECDGFPCARVKRLDKRYRTKYEMSMIENLEYIRDILEKIMLDADKYESSNYAKKAAWWRGATLRLEKEVGKETAIKIMESCGRKCCGGTYRKHAEKYWMESESVEDFLDKLNNYVWHGQVVGIGGGRLKLKQFFESALGRAVEVDLLQSIITGADSCEFISHI